MEINYNINEQKLQEYILECRKLINESRLEEKDFKDIESIKTELNIQSNNYVNIIKKYRQDMIYLKIRHTARVVNDVELMANSMGVNINFKNLVKVAALLHDIGRFKQATWSNTYADGISFKNFTDGTKNHAMYGYKILKDEGRINDFDIPREFQEDIMQVVLHHGDNILPDDLRTKINDINDLDLNEHEQVIVSTLVQMVRDVDKLDILYQHLTREFPVVRNSINYDVENDTLKEISEHWGIDEEEIIKINNLKSSDISNLKTIVIPVENVDYKKLEVPQDIKQKFFTNEQLDLKELQARRDWTFITGMWWRLSTFLRDINFTSNLEIVLNSNLLDDIYNTYPDKYKPLVKEAFDYAKEYLLKRPLELSLSEGNIYSK